MTERKHLPTYLNDHLAGATVGVQLAQRTASANADHPSGGELRTLAGEIEADRRSLLDLMDHLEVGRDRVKTTAAWAAERVARLKLNGELVRYSPLSRLEELEGLALGVEGKRSMWSALRRVLGPGELPPDLELDALEERASSQRARIEDLRLVAAEAALQA